MALTLSEIRAKLKAQEEAQQNPGKGSFNNGPSEFLAHWNIPENQPLNLRFLPDADQDNPYFWREREMIRLSFNGIKGGEQKRVEVTVPCNEMWGPVNSCPVTKELREWFKAGDPSLEERARAYWKKKSYLLQCFVAPGSCEVEGDNPPENPIRRVVLNKGIFNKVKSLLLNPRIEFMPTEYEKGRDFSIIKGKQGQYANYDQSQWDMYERPLEAAELEAIEKYGLFNLEDFMPKQPTAEHLQAIAEMFEASVNEEQYDPERWAAFYRPPGVQAPAESNGPSITPKVTESTPAAQPTQTVQVDSTPTEVQQPVAQSAPVEVVDTAPKKQSTADLLAKLKAKKA